MKNKVFPFWAFASRSRFQDGERDAFARGECDYVIIHNFSQIIINMVELCSENGKIYIVASHPQTWPTDDLTENEN